MVASDSRAREEVINPLHCDDVLSLSLLGVILPPLAVGFLRGWCGESFWICVILTILGYIPGVIYALYCVFTDPELKETSRRRAAQRAQTNAAAGVAAGNTTAAPIV